MFGTRERGIVDLALRQAGMVSYVQLAELGVTPRMVRRCVGSGEWIGELPCVVRMYWAEPGWLQRVWAASLWAGPYALLSHRTAAVLLGIDCPATEPIEVISAAGRSPALWLHVRRERSVNSEREVTAGLPHTSTLKTLFQLGEVMTGKEVEQAVRSAVRNGLTSLTALRRTFSKRRTFHGMRGAACLRVVVQRLVDGGEASSRADRRDFVC